MDAYTRMLLLVPELIQKMKAENSGIVALRNARNPHALVWEPISIDMYYHSVMRENTEYELTENQILGNEDALNLLFSWAISHALEEHKLLDGS